MKKYRSVLEDGNKLLQRLDKHLKELHKLPAIDGDLSGYSATLHVDVNGCVNSIFSKEIDVKEAIKVRRLELESLILGLESELDYMFPETEEDRTIYNRDWYKECSVRIYKKNGGIDCVHPLKIIRDDTTLKFIYNNRESIIDKEVIKEMCVRNITGHHVKTLEF